MSQSTQHLSRLVDEWTPEGGADDYGTLPEGTLGYEIRSYVQELYEILVEGGVEDPETLARICAYQGILEYS